MGLKKGVSGSFLFVLIVVFCVSIAGQSAFGAAKRKHYFAHDAVEDQYGVIAPWYTGLNGQCDFRVRVSAETLKRYPWVGRDKAVRPAPHFVYTSRWGIKPNGEIVTRPLNDWMCGDLGQRTLSLIDGLTHYYRYSGDPAAVAFISLQADYVLDYALTEPNHAWPNFIISCPVKGKPYGKCDPHGFIQLDISAAMGSSILCAYRLTGNRRYFEAAKRWGDLFAEKCKTRSARHLSCWSRYANPEDVPWGRNPEGNNLKGSIALILQFLDDLINMGHTGKGDNIIKARDIGRQYLNELFSDWTGLDTWGRYYWDWENPSMSLANTKPCVYAMRNPDVFPNWKNDVRNVISLIFNRTSVDPRSICEVYHGAWAVAESEGCCEDSLSYGTQITASALAQYGALANDRWAKEIARRMQILGTYDILDNGRVIDGITGRELVAGEWLNIIHPVAMRYVLRTMAWLPEVLGANRENHIMRTSSDVTSVVYGKGKIIYSVYDSPRQSLDVLRLAFKPKSVTADGNILHVRKDLKANGYTVRNLSAGDCIVTIRHDGMKNIVVEGNDPQEMADDKQLTYVGNWNVKNDKNAFGGKLHVASGQKAVMTHCFVGNQVRLIGSVDCKGGLADIYIDGHKQLVHLDCWNQYPRHQQVLYYKNGLPNTKHELKIVTRGAKNLLSDGNNIYIDAVQYSAATGNSGFGSGGGPTSVQRMIFGYDGREDYEDIKGNKWRPATEFVTRFKHLTNSIERTWWTGPAPVAIVGTDDPLLYSFGVHAPKFVVNITTAGQGKYYVRLKFASARGLDTRVNCCTVLINGKEMVRKMDVAATAGGKNRAVDLVFNNITPGNGVIEICFIGGDADTSVKGEAFVQAIEVGPGNGGRGAIPVTIKKPKKISQSN